MKAEDYTHRIGRTGRAGRDGLAVTFAEFRDRRRIGDIEAYTQQRFKPEVVPGLEPRERAPQPERFGGRGRGGDRFAGRSNDRFGGDRRGAPPRGPRFENRDSAPRFDNRDGAPRFDPRGGDRFDAARGDRAARQDTRFDPRFEQRTDQRAAPSRGFNDRGPAAPRGGFADRPVRSGPRPNGFGDRPAFGDRARRGR
jgi:superfamily II DNA/RNA helicase